MEPLSVQLFGRFTLRREAAILPPIGAVKAQELFCYLALNRDRPQNRETLCGVLWEDGDAEQSRKYLRQALWQLQASLQPADVPDDRKLLQVDASWVALNSAVELQVDAAELERAFERVRDLPGDRLDPATAGIVRRAVALYRGDLLEGWYHDWCLFERERFQTIYLILLDKLMHHCEARGEYESGIAYGQAILRIDRAREHTHRHMMRLYARSGDRTAALRQFTVCVAALRDELDVAPNARTTELAARIRADRFPDPPRPEPPNDVGLPMDEPPSINDVGARLTQLRTALSSAAALLATDIELVDDWLAATPDVKTDRRHPRDDRVTPLK
jgi:DNA-binding SARP family transcriptional activator